MKWVSASERRKQWTKFTPWLRAWQCGACYMMFKYEAGYRISLDGDLPYDKVRCEDCAVREGLAGELKT